MELKQILEDKCAEYRKQLKLSDNPGHPRGLALKWRNETDWSVAYKDKRYVPVDFTNVGFIDEVVNGKPQEVEEMMTEKIAQQQAVEEKKEKKNVPSSGDVRTANFPTTNLLLIFDKDGNDVSKQCTMKTMKNDLKDIVDYIYLDGKLIAKRKNLEITMTNKSYVHMLFTEVPKDRLKEKAIEAKAVIMAEIEKQKQLKEDLDTSDESKEDIKAEVVEPAVEQERPKRNYEKHKKDEKDEEDEKEES